MARREGRGGVASLAGVKGKNTSKRKVKATKAAAATPAAKPKTTNQKLTDWLKGADPDVGRITVSDFIRLVQLQKELKAEKRPREIKVTWLEPEEKP